MAHAPYRADHVGSLLRGRAVADARKAHYEDGRIDADELRAIEDAHIREVIARQEAVGLKAVTDGETRRAFWHYDFMSGLTGMSLVRREQEGVQFAGKQLPPIFPGGQASLIPSLAGSGATFSPLNKGRIYGFELQYRTN